MSAVGADWNSIIAHLKPLPNRNLFRSIVGRLIVSVSAYFIWQERNFRFFKKGARSEDQLYDIIFANVRIKILSLSELRILSLRIKNSFSSSNLMDHWKIDLRMMI